MTTETDHFYLDYAITLAKKGNYSAKPNPCVGAVIVRNNQIISEGFHRYAGELHAERAAILNSNANLKEATLYVTLEPCNHHGKTPPCTDIIIQSELSRVVIASKDSNPNMQGQSFQILENAGIEVCFIEKEEALKLNQYFFFRMANNRPYISLKMAMSLDGNIALASGESQWITEDKAREDVHLERSVSCAIATGIGTILADNPQLTPRNLTHTLPSKSPHRFILDTHCRVPITANILNTSVAETHLFIGEHCSSQPNTQKKIKQLTEKKVQIHPIPIKNNHLDLTQWLMYLSEKMEINRLWIESGSKLFSAFIHLDLYNEIILYTAPKFLGNEGNSLFIEKLSRLSDAKNFQFDSISQIGQDLKIRLLPKTQSLT